MNLVSLLAFAEKRADDRQFDRHALVDVLPVATYTTDAAGRLILYNKAAAELAGREPEIGKDEWCVTWRLYWPDGTPMPHDRCPMAIALKQNRAIRGEMAILERPDGTRIPFLAYPTPLRDASGTLIGAVNILVDLRDHIAAEIDSAYLAAIVTSSDDAIIGKNLDGIVTSWNRGAEAILGYLAEEIVGRPGSVLFPLDRLNEDETILARLKRGERVDHFETARLHKDGREIDLSVTISPVRNSMGQIIGISKVARNISEKKRTDTALRQAQKMEAVGHLAAGMAHEFNNLLTVILGNLELLNRRLPDDSQRGLTEAAIQAAQRGARLNMQLLGFSRKQFLVQKKVNLDILVGRVLDTLRHTLGDAIEVRTALAPDFWQTLVDPAQLETVLHSLVINARDAMPAGGILLFEGKNVRAYV